MHYSAKRGIAIACRPSVRRPCVCDVGESGPHRSEILETNYTGNQPNIFAVRSPKVTHLLSGNMGKFGSDESWGGERRRAGVQKRQYL